ncbi:AsnC family transcriptional regulator [Nocardia sp. SYP-A9097]|uniref:Lrp/AsnC family transcriptional regulator n=1 Tax=Nocardia sp. SYP-A9097 TaxID=2663237 RepID=UPI00129C0564|nr:Lrp/AsnC family transcriptional regulator [Nocardia sp. SYP-A9097]MRH90752.1 AsnC family transcriptional regulator [Nocardia sp. SYP-A9097]
MSTTPVRETAMLDLLDTQIMQALQFQPRLPFAHIAAELGVAEQTVARRYRRLRRDGILRVIGAVDARALGESDWIIRLHCRPDGAVAVAEALAQRDDAAWISIAAAGAEIIFSLHPRSEQDRDDLLVQRLQRSAPVHDITAAMILHRFVRQDVIDWRGRQFVEGRESGTVTGDYTETELRIGDQDRILLDLLARDGRTSYTVLARSTGMSIGRVTRRIAALQAGGILYFDLDIAPAAIGSGTWAFLWLRVAPAHVEAVGHALAEHDETTYAAAITGSFNIFAVITAPDTNALYRYITTKMSTLAGVHSFELSPVLHRLKQAGSRTTGGKLAHPSPLSRAGHHASVRAR